MRIYIYVGIPDTFVEPEKPQLGVSGSQSYTENEKRVLEHTSRINSNIFVPFMSIDLQEKFVFSIPFTDKVRIYIFLFHILEKSFYILFYTIRMAVLPLLRNRNRTSSNGVASRTSTMNRA